MLTNPTVFMKRLIVLFSRRGGRVKSEEKKRWPWEGVRLPGALRPGKALQEARKHRLARVGADGIFKAA